MKRYNTLSAGCSLVLALALLLLWPAAAWSHAHPQQRTPAPKATLKQAPQAAKILFSEELEGVFSTLTVVNAAGEPVTKGESHVPDNKLRLLVVPLKTLQSGTYTVKWHVVSRDGHTTEGQYQFTVKP